MPKKSNRSEQNFQQYDTMTSEELSNILRLDSEAPEGNALDIDTLLYITGVLAERKKNSEITGKTSQEAWNSFQQSYMPSEDEILEYTEETKPEKTRSPWIRRAIAAAAVVALLVFVPLTATALNWEEIWNAVAKWAKETFSFVREDQPEVDEPAPANTRQYTSLAEALGQMGLDPNLVPTWIPEGYVLDRIDVDETPMQRNYIALYTNGEKVLYICIRAYVEMDPEKIEISENLIEIYKPASVNYYIHDNNGWISAAWIQDNFESNISGEISVEEIKKMIDSIPKG